MLHGDAVVRRAQGPLQLRLPAPDPRGRARRPGRARRRCPRARWAPRCSRCASGPRRRRRPGGTGDRDSAPPHTDQVWRQVSVSHRECLGATQCPYGAECFAERAKERAAPVAADRHQPLAARDRRDRGRADDPGVRRRGGRRGARAVRPGDPGRHRRAVRAGDRPRRPAVAASRRGHRGRRPRPTPATRCATPSTTARPAASTRCPSELADALALVRDAARALRLGVPQGGRRARRGRRRADRRPRAGSQELFKTAERMAAGSENDVLWIAERERSRGGNQLCVAPLEVWGPLRERLLAREDRGVHLATLKLGGDFDAVATSLGLKPAERVDHSIGSADPATLASGDGDRRGGASTSGRRSTTASRRSCTSPGTCRRRAATGSAPGAARRDRRPGRRRRRPHPRAVLEPPGRRGGRRGRARAAAAPDDPGPGRRPAARAGAAVRRTTRTPACSAR